LQILIATPSNTITEELLKYIDPKRRADMDEEIERGLRSSISIIQNGHYIKYTTRLFYTGQSSFWFKYSHADRSNTQYRPRSSEVFSIIMARNRLVINPGSLEISWRLWLQNNNNNNNNN
jgi:hypothetical protein